MLLYAHELCMRPEICCFMNYSSSLLQVLLTLAAFAKSPDVAASMMHTLESVQVLNTVPGGGVMGGGVGGGGVLVQPQAKEGSIQVWCCIHVTLPLIVVTVCTVYVYILYLTLSYCSLRYSLLPFLPSFSTSVPHYLPPSLLPLSLLPSYPPSLYPSLSLPPSHPPSLSSGGT